MRNNQVCDETSKDEKQYRVYEAVDKYTSNQQVCVLDGSHLHCAKKLDPYT